MTDREHIEYNAQRGRIVNLIDEIEKLRNAVRLAVSSLHSALSTLNLTIEQSDERLLKLKIKLKQEGD